MESSRIPRDIVNILVENITIRCDCIKWHCRWTLRACIDRRCKHDALSIMKTLKTLRATCRKTAHVIDVQRLLHLCPQATTVAPSFRASHLRRLIRLNSTLAATTLQSERALSDWMRICKTWLWTRSLFIDDRDGNTTALKLISISNTASWVLSECKRVFQTPLTLYREDFKPPNWRSDIETVQRETSEWWNRGLMDPAPRRYRSFNPQGFLYMPVRGYYMSAQGYYMPELVHYTPVRGHDMNNNSPLYAGTRTLHAVRGHYMNNNRQLDFSSLYPSHMTQQIDPRGYESIRQFPHLTKVVEGMSLFGVSKKRYKDANKNYKGGQELIESINKNKKGMNFIDDLMNKLAQARRDVSMSLKDHTAIMLKKKSYVHVAMSVPKRPMPAPKQHVRRKKMTKLQKRKKNSHRR